MGILSCLVDADAPAHRAAREITLGSGQAAFRRMSIVGDRLRADGIIHLLAVPIGQKHRHRAASMLRIVTENNVWYNTVDPPDL